MDNVTILDNAQIYGDVTIRQPVTIDNDAVICQPGDPLTYIWFDADGT